MEQKSQQQTQNSSAGNNFNNTNTLPPHPQQQSQSTTATNYFRNMSPRTNQGKNKNSYLSNSSTSSNGKKYHQTTNFANTFSKTTHPTILKDSVGANASSKTSSYSNNYPLQNISSPQIKISNNILPTMEQILPAKSQEKVPDLSLSQKQLNAFTQQLEQIFIKYEEEKIYCDQVDDDILILTTVCDLENQRVVRADADRTRSSETINKDKLELILTLYCKRNNIKYKQGLNEVLAPFLYLQEAANCDIKVAYNCFSIFLWRFLTTFYLDEDFFSLQSALALVQLLFRYHEPELAIHIDLNSISPEMFATPWFLTYFAKAQSLRDGTPHSFRELPDQKLIFNYEYQQQPKDILLQNLEKLENLPCLPILSEELFFYSYPELLSCSNPSCLNSLNSIKQAHQQQQQTILMTQNTVHSQGASSGGGGRRNSATFDEFELLSPSREYERQQKTNEQQQQQSIVHGTSNHIKSTSNDNSQYGGGKKANIHEIIKKDILQSPYKYTKEDSQRGIDLSSQRSPFKHMNKQSPAQADAMPLETDSNVNDDAADIQDPKIIGNSPKAQLSQYLNKSQNGPGQQFTNDGTNQQNKKKIQIHGKGLSQSANKGSNLLTGLNNNLQNSQKQSNSSSYLNTIKMDYCNKCQKRRNYVDKNNNNISDINQTNDNSSNVQHTTSLDYGNNSILQPSGSITSVDPNQSINLDEENHELYYEKIRFLIVDCRLEVLQKEALLPNSFQFEILSECNKDQLQQQVDKLVSCKDIYHICLVGLEKFTSKFQKKFGNGNGEGKLDIGDYHERIQRFLIDDFQSKGFKHISIIPNGFQECHDLANQYNFSLLNHTPGNCFHCQRYSKDKYKRLYDDQFNLVGFTDIFSGFKHLYDVAGTKLKSFVRGGPTKILGNNQNPQYGVIQSSLGTNAQNQNIITPSGSQLSNSISNNSNSNSGGNFQQSKYKGSTTNQLNGGLGSTLTTSDKPPTQPQNLIQSQTQATQQNSQHSSNNNSIYSSLVVSKTGSESRNQGPHKQKKHQHKTTEDQNKLPMMVANQVSNDLLNINPNNMQSPLQVREGQSQKLSDMSLGSLPVSFVSQSSRQDVFSQFQGNSSHCSSNVSISSSQNDGNNLRDAISNKKIMSYKLMSKVPGDKSSDNNQLQINSQNYEEGSRMEQDIDVQIIVSPPNERENNDLKADEEIKSQAQNPLDLHESNNIRIELIGSNSGQHHMSKLSSKTANKDLTPLASNTDITDASKKLGAGVIAEVGALLSVLPEHEYYYANGITEQKDTSKQEFELIITKKSNIVYKTQKLNIKKKSETGSNSQKQHSSASTSPAAYIVYLVITPYSVSVLKENPNKLNISQLQLQTQLKLQNVGMDQSIESSSISQAEEWDQADFDELNPALGLNDRKLAPRRKVNNNIPNTAAIQQPSGCFAVLESRFLMHDLIKITSRKSSAKIITFYFRIPLLADYNSEILEKSLVQSLDQKPTIKYQFAFKRKNYKEVSVSFEFAKEEDAKQCITSVSSIYKKLKTKKQ